MDDSSFVIKARGLPWSATAEEVMNFFSDVNIMNGEDGVYFTFNKEGRPSGECFIEVNSENERDKALAHNNEHMGKRYIEIKEAKHSEMEWVVNRMQTGSTTKGENVVRLRGLPYGCSRQDIDAFFEGLQIIPYGITITVDQDGRASGDAYVEFATPEDAEAALGKHKEKIGHRYIEIFRSSKADIKHVVGQSRDPYNRPFMNSRPGPYDRPNNFGGPRRGRGGMNLGPSGFNTSSGGGGSYGGGYDGGRSSRGGRGGPMRGGRSGGMGGGGGGGMNNRPTVQNSKTGHSVHMRGLPFEATTNDVMQFFAPLNPVDIRFIHDSVSGRVKGECDVDFSTHNDAEAAMQKDKQNMGHRYIELFIKSTPGGTSMGGGGGGGGGGGWSTNNDMGGGGMQRRDGPVPLMSSGNQGYNMGGGSMGGVGGGSDGGGFGQPSNNYSNVGSNYSVGAPSMSGGGGYGNYGGGNNNMVSGGGSGGMSGGGGYDYKGVSYPNIQSGGGGNYYGNMR